MKLKDRLLEQFEMVDNDGQVGVYLYVIDYPKEPLYIVIGDTEEEFGWVLFTKEKEAKEFMEELKDSTDNIMDYFD